MKLVAWYDNEWGYRYNTALSLSFSHSMQASELPGGANVMIHNGYFRFFLQQPSAGPHRAHGIGGGQQMRTRN